MAADDGVVGTVAAPSSTVLATAAPQSDMSSLSVSTSSKKRPALTDTDKRRLLFEKKKPPPSPSSAVSSDGVPRPWQEMSNKLIQFDQLKTLIEGRCACRICGSPVLLTQDMKGLATKIYLTCIPTDKRWTPHKDSIIPEKLPAVINVEETDRRKLPKDSTLCYQINFLFVLAMQQLGIGLGSATNLLGILGMRANLGDERTWKRLQDLIGEAEQAVKDEVIAENIEKARAAALEKGAQPDPNAEGRVPVPASHDMGWNKKGSGLTYNSNSGQAFLVCCLTKLILGVVCYSKLCALCDRNQPDPPDEDPDDDTEDDAGATKLVPATGHRCPKNYAGSSKAMEPLAAVELLTAAYNTGRIYVDTVVGDDDSSTRKVLQTDWRTYEAEFPDIPKETYWPVYYTEKNKEKKLLQPEKMPGRLPWFVSPPTRFLCDPTHRIRVIAGYLFKLAKKYSETGVMKTDCERLKENMGYAHKQFREVLTLEEYKAAWDAALWHMGNEHKFCNPSWCPYAGTEPKKNKKDNTHALEQGEAKFQSLKKVFYTYNTPHYLAQMHHTYDSQKNEALNQRVAKVAPKNRTFCKTRSLQDRIALVVVIDSVGFEVGITRIMQKLYGAAALSFPIVTQLWMHTADRMARQNKERQELPENKKKGRKEKTKNQGRHQKQQKGNQGRPLLWYWLCHCRT
jgi:hypothetical protein